MKEQLYPEIAAYLAKRETEFSQIVTGRRSTLTELSTYLANKYKQDETPRLIVICTHNSRRSHMGQVWLSVVAEYLGLPPLESYSGGTEATAFNQRSVAALRRTGIKITTEQADSNNPLYKLDWKDDMKPYEAFSKNFSESPNPTADFAAIMVCTDADEACPFVPGADFRLALPYEDPKAFDDTDKEAAMYDERCRQIAREILFALKMVS